MTEVPRHEFVPREYKSAAYRHTPLSIGHGQTISQPVIVALMTELLQPAETDKVLEVGTGSGYQAAILSVLAREVSTIEIVPEPGENFDTYDSMRIAQMPKVESFVMPSGGFWGGVGEPTICVAGPAVLNAFFNATGQRIRSFPLKNIIYNLHEPETAARKPP
jgi:hypothetical protein